MDVSSLFHLERAAYHERLGLVSADMDNCASILQEFYNMGIIRGHVGDFGDISSMADLATNSDMFLRDSTGQLHLTLNFKMQSPTFTDIGIPWSGPEICFVLAKASSKFFAVSNAVSARNSVAKFS